jgi:energy-coupling factor transporter ATP-binding protein EcfA2
MMGIEYSERVIIGKVMDSPKDCADFYPLIRPENFQYYGELVEVILGIQWPDMANVYEHGQEVINNKYGGLAGLREIFSDALGEDIKNHLGVIVGRHNDNVFYGELTKFNAVVNSAATNEERVKLLDEFKGCLSGKGVTFSATPSFCTDAERFMDSNGSTYSKTGFFGVDKLMGGLRHGQVTVLSGKSGEGKTTFLRQLSSWNIKRKERVALMMGEESPTQFRDMILRQSVGIERFDKKIDEWDNETYTPKQDLIDEFKDDYLPMFGMFNNAKLGSPSTMSDLAMWIKHEADNGTKLFIFDNLMTLTMSSGDQLLSVQGEVVQQVMTMARAMDVHIILVCHPRKGDRIISGDSISGSQNIYNLVDNVILYQRIDKIEDSNGDTGEIADFLRIKHSFSDNITVMVNINKNRFMQNTGFLGCKYDSRSNTIIEEFNGPVPDGYGFTERGTMNEDEVIQSFEMMEMNNES